MKRISKLIIFSILAVFIQNNMFSQCSNNNTFFIDLTPQQAGDTAYADCIYPGEYATVTVEYGEKYIFSTCGYTNFDTQLTLFRSNGDFIAYNDDACGYQSNIEWVADFSGIVHIALDQYHWLWGSCTHNSICMHLDVIHVGTHCPQPQIATNQLNYSCQPQLIMAQTPQDGFTTPGFTIHITTDEYSDTENSLNIFENNELYQTVAIGNIPANAVWELSVTHLNPQAVYSFEWCDNYPDGIFEYKIYDNITGNLLTDGTFNHNTGTTCYTQNIGQVTEGGHFSGDFVTDNGNGTAYFDTQSAGIGSFDVSYCYNTPNCDACTTQTILVSNNYFMDNTKILHTNNGYLYNNSSMQDYEPNRDDTLTIFACDTALGLKLIFEEFDLENSNNCEYDYLKIFNGENTQAPLIGSFCGSNSPDTIVANNNLKALTLVFHSDEYEQRKGFKIILDNEKTPVHINYLNFDSICGGFCLMPSVIGNYIVIDSMFFHITDSDGSLICDTTTIGENSLCIYDIPPGEYFINATYNERYTVSNQRWQEIMDSVNYRVHDTAYVSIEQLNMPENCYDTTVCFTADSTYEVYYANMGAGAPSPPLIWTIVSIDEPLLINFIEYTETNDTICYDFPKPGLYKVFLEGQNDHCGNYTDSIEVFIPYPEPKFNYEAACNTVLFNDSTICVDSLLWDFGDNSFSTTEIPTHIYDNGGSYIVTLTAYYKDSMYVYTDTVSIEYKPEHVQIAGDVLLDCAPNGTFTIDNPQTNTSYYWHNDQDSLLTTGTELTVNNGIGSVIGEYLIITSINNADTFCITYDTIPVMPCCDMPNDTSFYNDTILSDLTYSDKVIVINGTVWIKNNSTVFLRSDTIYMGPDAKIIVTDSSKLIVHRHSCFVPCSDYMWDGIYVEQTGYCKMLACYAYGAKNAVFAKDGGIINLLSSHFINNVIGVKVINYNPPLQIGQNREAYQGTIYNCKFNTDTNDFVFNSYINNRLLPPYQHLDRGYIGIYLNNVYGAHIGSKQPDTIKDKATGSYDFDFLTYGIRSINSNITVNDYSFYHISKDYYDKGFLSWTVGNIIPDEGAIVANFTNNIFSTIPRSITIGDTVANTLFKSNILGTYTYNAKINVTNIFGRNNSFSDIWVKNVNSGSVIMNNIISTNSNFNLKNSSAILVESVIPQDFDIRIEDNTFNFMKKSGIVLKNVQSSNVEIKNNTYRSILFDSDLAGFLTPDIKAIGIDNCNNVEIESNFISNESMLTQNHNKLIGIDASLSPQIEVCSNQMHKMGFGIACYGTMPYTKLISNTMNSCYNGIYLYDAHIGTQAAIDERWDNKWINNQGLYKVNGDIPNVITDWYYYEGLPEFDVQLSFFGVNPISTSTINLLMCRDAIVIPRPLYSDIINNDIIYETNKIEHDFNNKAYVYHKLIQDSTVNNNKNNQLYSEFIENMQNSTIGIIENVNTLTNNGNINQAIVANNSLYAKNNLEQNEQLVNTIYLNTWAKDKYTFTDNQYNILYNIAMQKAITGGKAVYKARIMLGIEPENNTDKFNNNNTTNTNYDANKVGKNIQVYPNPANEFLTIEYKNNTEVLQLELYNLLGNKIADYNLSANSTNKINIKSIETGIYYYRIIQNNAIVDTDKLIIIK